MKHQPILGCIADDFTGASDMASFLRRGGLNTMQINGLPSSKQVTLIQNQAIDAIVVALKTRTCDVELAVEQSISSLRWLTSVGCKRFYFKYCSTFDSTAKGNIGPVLDALMDELGCQQTLLCPALPVNGRTVYFGNLFVLGVPLAESPMANHPLTPMCDSNLIRLLASQVNPEYAHQVTNLSLEQIGQLDSSALLEGRYLVADAISQADLSQLASVFATKSDTPLLSGGSGLGEFLGEAYRQAGWLNSAASVASNNLPQGEVLILSGSCSQATREQVALAQPHFPALQLDPVLLHQQKQSLEDICLWLRQHQGQSVMIYSSAAPQQVALAQQALGEEHASYILESTMASIAHYAQEQALFHKFIVAGGETSGAVVSALNLTESRVGESVTPGVPLLFSDYKGQEQVFALKSGNFGGPDFFQQARSKMQ